MIASSDESTIALSSRAVCSGLRSVILARDCQLTMVHGMSKGCSMRLRGADGVKIDEVKLKGPSPQRTFVEVSGGRGAPEQ
jgi:hypothetical protein